MCPGAPANGFNSFRDLSPSGPLYESVLEWKHMENVWTGSTTVKLNELRNSFSDSQHVHTVSVEISFFPLCLVFPREEVWTVFSYNSNLANFSCCCSNLYQRFQPLLFLLESQSLFVSQKSIYHKTYLRKYSHKK